LGPQTEVCARESAEKQLGEFSQVAAPDHPAVHAGSFDVGVLDAFGGEPGSEIAIDFDQAVLGAAGDPEQVKLLAGFGVECRKFLVEFGGETAGAKRADVGKCI